jgi:hypothetical protein
MRPKLLCAISLLLNVALAGYWLKSRSARPEPIPPSIAAPPAPPQPVQRPATPTTSATVSVATSPKSKPSPWSRIESTDYPTFIANLRGTGCPERTIRDVITREIDKLHGAKPVTAAPQKDDFWLTTAGRESRNRSRRLAELGRASERRVLLKTLLGVEGDWPKNQLGRPAEWAGLCALLTPPTFEAAEEMAWVFDRTEFERERIETEAGSPLKLSEIENMKLLRDRTQANIAALVGQPRVAETLGLIRVVMIAMSDLDFLDSDDPKKRFSEAELRRLAVAQHQDIAVVDEMFGFEEVTKMLRFRAGLPKDASPGIKASFLASLAPVLGEQRARELGLRLAPGWSEVEEFVRDKKLPATTAEVLVGARILATEEARRIRQNPALTAAEESNQLQQIGNQLRTTLGEALAPDIWTEYLGDHGGWIEGIELGGGDDE